MTQTENGKVHYFAYGTLLGVEEIRRYCPSAEKVTVARYDNHRLEFWSYSDDPDRVGCHMANDPGGSAYGVVYEIPLSEIDDLDLASGTQHGWYRREPIEVTAMSGETIPASTYFLVNPIERAAPAESYSNLVRTGLSSQQDVPPSYAAQLSEYLDSVR